MLSDSAKSALTFSLWAAAVHRMSPRYMDLLMMDKNLNEFIKTKANSILLLANLFHLLHNARKSENLMHFLIGHNSVISCKHMCTFVHIHTQCPIKLQEHDSRTALDSCVLVELD